MYFTSLRHLVANVNFFLVSATAAVAVVARAVVFLYETNPGSDGQRNTFGSCLAVGGLDNFLEVVSSTAGRGRLTEFGGCSFLSIFDTSREAPAVQPTVAGNKRQKQVLLWYPMAATGRLTCKFIAPAAAFDSGTDGQKRRKMNSSISNQRR